MVVFKFFCLFCFGQQAGWFAFSFGTSEIQGSREPKSSVCIDLSEVFTLVFKRSIKLMKFLIFDVSMAFTLCESF